MAAPKPRAQAPTVADLAPQIAKRAYELFEEGGRQDGAAVKNWEKAESEIRKGQGKATPTPEAKAMPKSEIEIEPKTDAHTETPPDVPPQLVKRVHELYEKLGREDVQAVEDWERAKTREERPEK